MDNVDDDGDDDDDDDGDGDDAGDYDDDDDDDDDAHLLERMLAESGPELLELPRPPWPPT